MLFLQMSWLYRDDAFQQRRWLPFSAIENARAIARGTISRLVTWLTTR